jgi:hypothetical protein
MEGSWIDRSELAADGSVERWDCRVPLDTSRLRVRQIELARAADRSLAILEVLITNTRNEFRETIQHHGAFGADAIAVLVTRLSEIASLAEDRRFLFSKLEVALREVEPDTRS